MLFFFLFFFFISVPKFFLLHLLCHTRRGNEKIFVFFFCFVPFYSPRLSTLDSSTDFFTLTLLCICPRMVEHAEESWLWWCVEFEQFSLSKYLISAFFFMCVALFIFLFTVEKFFSRLPRYLWPLWVPLCSPFVSFFLFSRTTRRVSVCQVPSFIIFSFLLVTRNNNSSKKT